MNQRIIMKQLQQEFAQAMFLDSNVQKCAGSEGKMGSRFCGLPRHARSEGTFLNGRDSSRETRDYLKKYQSF